MTALDRPLHLNRARAVACLAVLLWSTGALASPAVSLAPDEVDRMVRGGGRYAWRAKHSIDLRDGEIHIEIGINLVNASRARVPKPDLLRARRGWGQAIERIWSRRFAIDAQDPRFPTPLPIVMRPRFKGRTFHYDVIVRPGRGRSHELRWHLHDTPDTAAHEFGHMLGAYDEYRGGATHPTQPRLDRTSIMSTPPSGNRVYARHYEPILAWFRAATGAANARLVPLPGTR